MIEVWYQITCNGCGDTDTSTIPNIGKQGYELEMRRLYRWQKCKGDLHYCSDCVMEGLAKRRVNIFSSPQPSQSTEKQNEQ